MSDANRKSLVTFGTNLGFCSFILLIMAHNLDFVVVSFILDSNEDSKIELVNKKLF